MTFLCDPFVAYEEHILYLPAFDGGTGGLYIRRLVADPIAMRSAAPVRIIDLTRTVLSTPPRNRTLTARVVLNGIPEKSVFPSERLHKGCLFGGRITKPMYA